MATYNDIKKIKIGDNVFNLYDSGNTNTTYTLSGALSSHKFTTTLTPSSGSATTSDFTLAAGTGITVTDDTTNRKMTIACSVTNTNTTYTLTNALSSHKFTWTFTAGGSGSGSTTTTAELVQGNNITLTDDTSNKKITIAAKDTTYSAGTGISLSGTTFSNSGVTSITTTAGAHTTKSSATGAVSFNVPTKTSHLTNDSGFITNAGVTGVKGYAETTYRTGNVNLTAANIGAVGKNDELLTTSPFAPASLRGPYISKIDNGFYAADKRWNVTLTNATGSVSQLFDGSYESNVQIKNGDTAILTLDFSNESSGYFPGYPYGYILLSFYYVTGPASISGRVYCNYQSQGIGWHDLAFTTPSDSTDGAQVYIAQQNYYAISKIEITIVGDTSNSYGWTGLTQVEMHLTRPDPSKNPFLSKYGAETLYYDLTAPHFIGNLVGNVTGNVTGNVSGTAANVTGTVAVANGGTGKTTGKDAANYFINSLDTGSSTPVDADYYVSQYVSGGTSTTTYHRRPMSALWSYINGKIDTVLGLTSTQYGGNAATATNASKVNNLTVQTAVPANAVFTDSTVSTLTLASGSTAGTALSHGGKYTLTAGTKTVSFTMPSDNNTTYTFADGTNSFKVTPSGGSEQTVTVTPSITNNITGSGTNGKVVKFTAANTIGDGYGVTDNSSSTAVTSTDTNLITGRTLYYAGYTKNAGTITGVTGNNGLTGSGTSGSVTIGHANAAITAQTTQAVYPIKIDAYGHITAYGSAVTIPSMPTYTVSNGLLTIG